MGVMIAESPVVSLNVMTLKSGFTSAILRSHSMHAPHGSSGLSALVSEHRRVRVRALHLT